MDVDRRFLAGDELCEELAKRRRVHDAVSGGTVGEEEIREAVSAAEEGVTVGRHFVQAGPAFVAIDCD